jgi:hypothetical protein
VRDKHCSEISKWERGFGNIVFSDIPGKPQETQLMNWRVAAESRTFPAGHGTELWSPCIVGNYPIY